MLIRSYSYARAGLIGNPSDGYHGKTISFIVKNYRAEVVLYESPEIEILPNERDISNFSNLEELVRDVRLHGYYGGLRLLKSSIKIFHQYCTRTGIPLHDRNFTIRYQSNIPSQVGMAGSSAIITACFKALMSFYGVMIPKPVLANLVLSVEKNELSIPAGLQDRVIQAYEGLVYMDFSQAYMEDRGYGSYEPLPPSLLPPVYVAFSRALSEGTEVLHNNLRQRYDQGDPEVLEAMQTWADLAQQTRDLLLQNRGHEIAPLINANFDLRRRLCNVGEGNIAMVEAARSVGASAKFTGSGGAIVGTYEDDAMFEKLRSKLESMNLEIVKPQIL